MFHSWLAALVVLLSVLLPGLARAESQAGVACFPKCRSGYVCTPEGKCVSECNPPCGGGEMCRAGECYAAEASTTAPASSESKSVEVVWAGGLGTHVSTVTAPVILTSFSVAFGHDHALLTGIGGGVAFFDNFIGTSAVGEVSLRLGYRGIFSHGDVKVGMLAALQPQLWFGGDTLLGLGGVVGPLLTYKRLVVEMPLGVVRVAVFDNHFKTSKSAVVFTPAVLAGISF